MNEEKEILQHFDSIFDTKVANHIKLNIPILRILFEKFEEDLYVSSSKYNDLRKEQIKISNKLYPTFTQEQKDLFDTYLQITNKLGSLEDEQLFYFGFIMSKELDNESKIIE